MDTAYPAFLLFVHALFADPGFRDERLASVRTLLCIGPPASLMQVQERLPHLSVINCYGITEAGGTAVVGDRTDPLSARIESAGLPKPKLALQIRDRDTGIPLGVGEVGVLWISGPDVIERYLNAGPDRGTDFDDRGWFATGDLGRLDDDGRYYYVGRVKDQLKVGGENVASLEIEGVLCGHPTVQTAAVVGAPDARLGEVPVAFVELRPGQTVDPDELIRFASERLAHFKVPRQVRFVTDWPMSSTKIQKGKLRELLADEGPAPVAAVQTGVDRG